MQILKVTLARLCISDGTCLCVEPRRRSSPPYQLVTKNVQDSTENLQPDHEGVVQVYDILFGTRKCMAFCFELGDKAIFPFTDGKEVHFKVLSSQVTESTFNDTFLFQLVETGRKDWQSLKSEGEPGMYLFYEDNTNKVTIQPVAMPDFKIEKGSTRTSKIEMSFKQTQHDNSVRKGFLCQLDLNHGPSFCEATALSTKSTCRCKRKSKKIKMLVKS